MWKPISRIFGGAAVFAMLLVSMATQVGASSGDEFAAVRAATAQFHDLDRAVGANYGKALPCFDNPGVGGMGQHYVNFSLIPLNSGGLIPTRPQALVYEVNANRLTLVAVEYLVPDTAPKPHLFGQPFHPAFLKDTPLGLWELHLWIWRDNPHGIFADWNPKVDLCP
jgi:hypothetical protein